MDIRDIFARNLRRLRRTYKLSQEALALEAGVGRSYLSRIEKGEYYASLRIIERLAKTFGVAPHELLNRNAANPGPGRPATIKPRALPKTR